LLGYPYDAYAALLFQGDLPLLRRAGKVVAVTYQGSDARQRDVTLANLEPEIVDVLPPDFFPPESDELKRRSIAGFDRYADLVYAVNPDLLRMLPTRARFLPYAHIDPRTYDVKLPDPKRPPVVVHAPSHKGRKGTSFLVRAVEKLRAEGVEIDFRLVENVSHSELQRIWYEADVVIDQLLIGWYGGTAVEAMSHGKPVVARLSVADLDLVPAAMRDEIPIVNARPGTIEDALRDLLGPRRRELAALGERSRRYAETWHDPIRIAAGLRDDYERVITARMDEPARKAPGSTLCA
jgi:glycosyltransferase involved in cell wall biosynthesis